MTPGRDLGRAIGMLRERSEFSPFARRLLLPAQNFIRTAGAGGFLLLAAAAIALAWANSPGGTPTARSGRPRSGSSWGSSRWSSRCARRSTTA